jgi:hypothetical protein
VILTAVGSIVSLFSATESEQCGTSWCYILEQYAFLYDTHVEYGSARKCRRKFRRKFCDERDLSRQIVHNLVNKLRSTGLLIDKKQKHKLGVFAEEKISGIGAIIEHTSRKSLKRLAQRLECQILVQERRHNC